MPSRRKLRPPIWTRPSTTGDTGQPARRRSTNRLLRKCVAVLAHQRCGARAAEHRRGADRRKCAPAGSAPARRSTARVAEISPTQKRRQLHRMPPPVAEHAANVHSARLMRSVPHVASPAGPASRPAARCGSPSGNRSRCASPGRARAAAPRQRYPRQDCRSARPPASSSGFGASARPIATRCCWPPESCSG